MCIAFYGVGPKNGTNWAKPGFIGLQSAKFKKIRVSGSTLSVQVHNKSVIVIC